MAVWNPHGIPLSSVPDLLLSSGRTVPIIGLGTWQIKPAEAAELIATAIDIGYRHFDCASFYGNLEGIGNGINTKVAQGYVAREEIFITAKLPVYMNDPADVREALKTSLKQLKLNYVDMFLVHTPVSIERGVGILMGPEIFHSKPESPSEYFKDIDPSLVWKSAFLTAAGFVLNRWHL